MTASYIIVLLTLTPIITTEPKESLILGTYRLVSDIEASDYDAVLKAMGFRYKFRERFRECPKLMIEIGKIPVESSPGYKYTYKYSYCDCFEMRNHEFKPNKEFNISLCDQRVVNAVVSLSTTKNFLKKTLSFDGFNCSQKAVFGEDGMNVTYSVKGKKAELQYERFYGLMFNKKLTESDR